ncbi:MAG: hypothetical protein H6Q89_289 [Myxococcaceae bacterium]|nr:hypothetical protein [Myxococcaceae bacterium]
MIAAALLLGACATPKPSVGEDHLFDSARSEQPGAPSPDKKSACGPEGKGDVVLLDARTAGPLTCTMVTVTKEPASCPRGESCLSEAVFKGHTNARGQIAVAEPFSNVRLVAVADGYSPSYLEDATLTGSKILELEMAPSTGFWLKALDPEGNYLQDLLLSFKQGEEVVANLRTNDLANVFFTQRNPFSGEPVTIEAPGYKPATVANITELGADGHTLTLQK